MKWLLTSAATASVLALAACGPQNDYDAAQNDDPYDQTERGNSELFAEDSSLGDGDTYADADTRLGDLTEADREASQQFAFEAAYASLMQTRASQIAMDRSVDPKVRALARAQAAFYSEAETDLRTAIEGAQIVAPTFLEDEHLSRIDDLTSSTGDSFDADYLDFQEEMLEATLADFEDYADDGPNAKLRAYATATLPRLRAQLDDARDLRSGFDIDDDLFGLGSGGENSQDNIDEDARQTDAPAE